VELDVPILGIGVAVGELDMPVVGGDADLLGDGRRRGGGGGGRHRGRRRRGGEAVALPLLRETERGLGRRRRQRLDPAEEVVQQGADGAQRLGVGVVRVGERVALADGQREELGAHPAVAHRVLLLHLGLAAPHGDRPACRPQENRFLFLPLTAEESPVRAAAAAATAWRRVGRIWRAGAETSRSGVATSYWLQRRWRRGRGVSAERFFAFWRACQRGAARRDARGAGPPFSGRGENPPACSSALSHSRRGGGGGGALFQSDEGKMAVATGNERSAASECARLLMTSTANGWAVGVGYGARGIEARLSCCPFGAVVLPEKRAWESFDGRGGEAEGRTETEEDRGGGVGHPRGDIRTSTPVAGRGGAGWILPCCAAAASPPATTHLLGCGFFRFVSSPPLISLAFFLGLFIITSSSLF
jgi:hypothetical protein